jgi:RNA polymerase sigma-70 factor (ECF subfamily)
LAYRFTSPPMTQSSSGSARCSSGERLASDELCVGALCLGQLIAELMPDDAEVRGLLALMLLHDARRLARVDEHGRYVALADQDRGQWNRAQLDETAGTRPRRRCRPGPYVLEAAMRTLTGH